jgi:hypothetical protein
MKQAILLVAIIAAQTFSTVQGQQVSCSSAPCETHFGSVPKYVSNGVMVSQEEYDAGACCNTFVCNDIFSMRNDLQEGIFLSYSGSNFCNTYNGDAEIQKSDITNSESESTLISVNQATSVILHKCCGYEHEDTMNVPCTNTGLNAEATCSSGSLQFSNTLTINAIASSTVYQINIEDYCCLTACSDINNAQTSCSEGTLFDDSLLAPTANPQECCRVPQCMDNTATNYNSAATIDDGSCTFDCSEVTCGTNYGVSTNNLVGVVSQAEYDDGACCVSTCGDVFSSSTKIRNKDLDTLEGTDFCDSYDSSGVVNGGDIERIFENDYLPTIHGNDIGDRVGTILNKCCGFDAGDEINVQCGKPGFTNLNPDSECSTDISTTEFITVTALSSPPFSIIPNFYCCLKACNTISNAEVSDCPDDKLFDSSAFATVKNLQLCCGGNDIVEDDLRYIHDGAFQTIPVAHLEAIKTAVDANADSFNGDCAYEDN